MGLARLVEASRLGLAGRKLLMGHTLEAFAGSRSISVGRPLHTSPASCTLGIVEQLHDEVSIALPSGSGRSFWEVVEFRVDGTALETWKTPEVLGLHPRDVHLFTGQSGLSQRAMIAPRGSAILFRTDAAKAVIYSDRAVLFPSRRLSDTVRVAQAIKSMITQRSALPFELKILESLLSETALAFDKKTKRLGMVAETVLDDINRSFHASAAELQRFIPISRKLTEVQHDVKETLEAIADVVNYDEGLQSICLTERAKTLAGGVPGGPSASPDSKTVAKSGSTVSDGKQTGKEAYSSPHQVRTPHMRMATRILESYEFKLEQTNGTLREMLETMEQTRTVWHMQLDHQRNRVLRVNLLISIASLGGLLCTLPAAFFGMNLDSGLENVPGIFWPVVQGSLITGLFGAGAMYTYYKYGPKRRYAARLRDMRSLRDLLYYHMDDIDSIIDAVKAKGILNRSEFDRVVRAAVKGRPMSQGEIALLFRVFDQNQDALVELSELVRMEELHDELNDNLAHHTS
jgi:magnesium transporter